MDRIRSRFQGVTNILRFNWHFYVLAGVMVVLVLSVATLWDGAYWLPGLVVAAGILLTTLTSLIASWYIYDHSELYTLNWLHLPESPDYIINVHAGFDETSALLVKKFPQARLRVLDFYDPALHPEISIKRARRAYPPYPGTERVSTVALSPAANSQRGAADLILISLSAHEIRDEQERAEFFRQLRKLLKPGGRIVVTEHLRNAANFVVYTVGFLHFLSRESWLTTFAAASLIVERERKITPFLTVFTLVPDGNAP